VTKHSTTLIMKTMEIVVGNVKSYWEP